MKDVGGSPGPGFNVVKSPLRVGSATRGGIPPGRMAPDEVAAGRRAQAEYEEYERRKRAMVERNRRMKGGSP